MVRIFNMSTKKSAFLIRAPAKSSAFFNLSTPNAHGAQMFVNLSDPITSLCSTCVHSALSNAHVRNHTPPDGHSPVTTRSLPCFQHWRHCPATVWGSIDSLLALGSVCCCVVCYDRAAPAPSLHPLRTVQLHSGQSRACRCYFRSCSAAR